jgi:hypothetical protein
MSTHDGVNTRNDGRIRDVKHLRLPSAAERHFARKVTQGGTGRFASGSRTSEASIGMSVSGREAGNSLVRSRC